MLWFAKECNFSKTRCYHVFDERGQCEENTGMADKAKQESLDLRNLVEEVFSFDSERFRPVRNAMAYLFTSKREILRYQGLAFEVILNSGRYDYIAETLRKLSQIEQNSQQSQSIGISREGALMNQTRHKKSLLPHMPPPGETRCPLDDLERNPLLIGRLHFNQREYGLVVNNCPWEHNHLMLVTFEHDPQSMTERELLAGFQLLRRLGPDYEGIFTGVLAGASVYHFHLQVLKRATAIWQNLECGSVYRKQFYSSKNVTVSSVEGWPARMFIFEGADSSSFSSAVHRMTEVLVAGDNDFPYNLGFRCRGNLIQLILVPRSGLGEKPTCLNHHPYSWGRFAFGDMGGSIIVLTPEGYEATIRSRQGIYDAIAEMSIQQHEQDTLIRDFLA